MINQVTFHVPATSANLGPGYDCLGVALQLHNRITVRKGGPASEHPMAATAAAHFFKTADQAPFDFHWAIEGDVPSSRGLGSSVTVRLGLLHGLNALAGEPLSRESLFEICARLEGHPDNAAPAEFGGFTIAKPGAHTLRWEVSPELHFVLLIPDFEISTPAARAALPATLGHRQAVASSANACRIAGAFAQQRYELLRGCFRDEFHQPFREPLIPFLPRVISAGEKAGALGGFLSGSGSTICCVTLDNPEPVAAAMAAAAQQPARVLITRADNLGAARG